MNSNWKNQRSRESSHSHTGNPVQPVITRYFSPSEEKLVSTLGLLRSYQTVLQAGVYLTRLFGVPLTSDDKAAGISSLFSTHEPLVLEIEQTECSPIHWADVLRSPIYTPELQETGDYHVRIEKANALVILSKGDHDFIATGLPRQLIDPQSYPDDLISEINTVDLAMARVAPWRDIAVQCSSIPFCCLANYSTALLINFNAVTEVIDNVLTGLSKRKDALEKKNARSEHQQNSSNHAELSSDASAPTENTESSQPPIQRKRRKSRS